MDKLNIIIADNLKKIREEKKLSLDSVAKLSGVSKSMLGQIERCEVNPTVSTMWKIANGLRISFTQFISNKEADVEIVDINNVSPFIEDEGNVKIYSVFPYDSTRRFEIYSLIMEIGGYLSTEPHLSGTQEFISVHTGKLVICLGDEEFIIEAGNSIRFKADRPHSYKNVQNMTCSLSMIIYYPI